MNNTDCIRLLGDTFIVGYDCRISRHRLWRGNLVDGSGFSDGRIRISVHGRLRQFLEG